MLAVCAAAHFLLALLGVGSRNVRGLLGFAVILLCMLVIGRTYNDPYVTMNSPVKLAVQFACAGVMLGMTADLRMLLCKPAPRPALTVLSAGSFFGVAGALPARRPDRRVHSSGRAEGGQLYFVYLCFSAPMGVYMLIRLAQCVFAAGASDVPVEAEPKPTRGTSRTTCLHRCEQWDSHESVSYIRIQWFHDELTRKTYPNAARLSERFGISVRQAQRDITYMRTDPVRPLQYDAGRQGYAYTTPFSCR